MGYYIEGPALGKSEHIIASVPGTRELGAPPASLRELEKDEGLVCVVNNGPFEAAGYVFSDNELKAFTNVHDLRPKRWLVGPRSEFERLCSYTH